MDKEEEGDLQEADEDMPTPDSVEDGDIDFEDEVKNFESDHVIAFHGLAQLSYFTHTIILRFN